MTNRRQRRKAKKELGRVSGPGSLLNGGGASVNTLVYEPWMPIFPARVKKMLRYSTSIGASSTTGAITSTQVFRANDLFDPDFTGTGHQPMGFDQLMVFYNHFCVTKAKIRCVFKNTAGSAPTACLRVDANSTPLTVIDRIVEFGGSVTETLEVKGTYGANKILEMTVDVAKLQGIKSIETMLADPTLRGDAATSPTEVNIFILKCGTQRVPRDQQR